MFGVLAAGPQGLSGHSHTERRQKGFFLKARVYCPIHPRHPSHSARPKNTTMGMAKARKQPKGMRAYLLDRHRNGSDWPAAALMAAARP